MEFELRTWKDFDLISWYLGKCFPSNLGKLIGFSSPCYHHETSKRTFQILTIC